MAELDLEALRRQLAAIEHQRWADWQRWMHEQCRRLDSGELAIPAALVERWDRQIDTPYEQLGEAEQRSDIDQVDRYWPLILAALERIPELELEAQKRGAGEAFLGTELHSLRARCERQMEQLVRVQAEAKSLRHGVDCVPDVACTCGLIHLRAALAAAPAPPQEADQLQWTLTERGFRLTRFIDCGGEPCSLQKSSIADEDRVWLGRDETNEPGRMHLNQAMVAALLPALHRFVQTGELWATAPEEEGGGA